MVAPGRRPERPVVRPYEPADHDAVYDVCVRTGDGGRDATGQLPDDRLIADVYVGPYLALEPARAFVLDDGGRAVGYIVGTADTVAFVAAYRARWLPQVRDRHPQPITTPRTRQAELVALLHAPERMVPPFAAEYPAHLHVNLLPAHQGGGHGRTLVRAFLVAVRRAGAEAVHLGVAVDNLGAQAFYERLGFHRIEAGDPDTVHYGRATADPP